MNVLSIDWDFFINANYSERYFIFPDSGNELLNKELQAYVWSKSYTHKTLNAYNFIPDANLLKKLKALIDIGISKSTKILIADKHENIYDFIEENYKEHKAKTSDSEPIYIANIDYHHDVFDVGETLNSGNWFRRIMEKYSNEGIFTWVAKRDSADYIHDAMLPDLSIQYEDFSGISGKSWDAIFICRSSMWSPPHLDDDFTKFFSYLVDDYEAKTIENVFKSRYDRNFIKLVDSIKNAEQEFWKEIGKGK